METPPVDRLPQNEANEEANRPTKILKIQYRDEVLELDVSPTETVTQFANKCADATSVEIERLSLFFIPKPGLLKFPFNDRLLTGLLTPSTRIKLIGTSKQESKKLDNTSATSQIRNRSGPTKPVSASKYRDWRKTQEEITYTFHSIEPLPYLPNPEKSRRFLERLANDPGIKSSMRKHKFSVGLLTEMNPAEHTTHESRTLGLNRNAGEVIELRLRTDRYDGYRDYKVIRKTLCHELSHNVHQDHNREFYDLMKEIEKEVEQGDWKHGGQRLTNQEFYNPDDMADPEHTDSGGWSGSDFVLGRSDNAENETGLSRREIIARAAMDRQKREKEAREQEQS